MFDWVLNAPLLPLKNKEIILHEKLYGPFLWLGFNCLKATEPLRGESFLFTTQSPGVPGTHLMDLGKMKGCGLPWNHPAVLNLGLLDWESCTLTTNVIREMFIFYALLLISPLDKICRHKKWSLVTLTGGCLIQ